jgi:hypothetical protein
MRLDEITSRIERGELVVRNPELERRTRSLDSSVRRATSSVLFLGLLIGGIVVGERDQTLSYVLLTVSMAPLVHALGIERSSR